MNKFILGLMLFVMAANFIACGNEACDEIQSPDGNIEYYDCPSDY